ncbi:MAG TPA: SRPBCC family protein [bacterium]
MADQITQTIIVERNINDVFQLWANFENFPQFMKNIKSVRKMGDRKSHWVMDGPLGKNVEWDADTTVLEPNKRIAWQSSGGTIDTKGEVLFRSINPDETEVTATIQYKAPTGAETIAKLFDNPEKKLKEDLENFKQFAESTVSSHTDRL